MPINDVVNKGNFLIYLQPPQMSKKRTSGLINGIREIKETKLQKNMTKKKQYNDTNI